MKKVYFNYFCAPEFLRDLRSFEVTNLLNEMGGQEVKEIESAHFNFGQGQSRKYNFSFEFSNERSKCDFLITDVKDLKSLIEFTNDQLIQQKIKELIYDVEVYEIDEPFYFNCLKNIDLITLLKEGKLTNDFVKNYGLKEIAFFSKITGLDSPALDYEGIIPLLDNAGFICFNGETKSKEIDEIFRFLQLELIHFVNVDSQNDEGLFFLEKVISYLSSPMAVFSLSGELLIYNKPFTDLKLFSSKCFTLKDKTHFETESKIYKVNRFEDDIGVYFNFQTQESDKGSSNGQELGIISSSIAHELNNPLAGILAALNLLMLDDWDNEAKAQLEEMLVSATRCKKLVELFLGFSKTSINYHLDDKTENIIEQALSLLKFRMIESGVRIKLNKNVHERFSKGSSCINTMIVYLLLNEYLTELSHFNLIRPSTNNMKTINIDLNIFDSRLEFKSKRTEQVYSAIIESNLFRQLLVMSKINVKMLEDEYLILEAMQ